MKWYKKIRAIGFRCQECCYGCRYIKIKTYHYFDSGIMQHDYDFSYSCKLNRAVIINKDKDPISTKRVVGA